LKLAEVEVQEDSAMGVVGSAVAVVEAMRESVAVQTREEVAAVLLL
jgi:hypothetical protein